MPLIPCPACGRQISTQAESCPQCGHPNRAASSSGPAGPTCYACSAQATTRCQRCGALSCAQHLQSIYVSHGRGGAYELRCESCYSSAAAWQIVGWVIAGIAIIIFIIIFFSMSSNKPNNFPFQNQPNQPPAQAKVARGPDPGEDREPFVNPRREVPPAEREEGIRVQSGTSTVVLLGFVPGQAPLVVASALVPGPEPPRGPRMMSVPGAPRMIPGGPGRPPIMVPGPPRMVPAGPDPEPRSRLPWWWKESD